MADSNIRCYPYTCSVIAHVFRSALSNRRNMRLSIGRRNGIFAKLSVRNSCQQIFEEKVVKFDNTKIWWRVILRVAVGGGLYLGFNELLKLIVGAIYPDYKSAIWFERIFRVTRYAVVSFLMIGVYPLLFKQTDKLWKKWKWIKTEEPTEQPAETSADGNDGGEITVAEETAATE